MRHNLKIICCFIALYLVQSNNISSQQKHSDNGDGTYTNPLIYADFPDCDVIRVDSVYYFVSTTMFVFPGVTILKSYDLVNWEYCSNAVPRFDFSPCYNLDGCNRYAHGQWATSLKYNNGKFYLLFVTLDEGGFIVSATNPEGPWETKKLPRGFYDPGLFFDDDGKIYVAHGYSKINITELDSNFVAKSKDSLVFTGDIRDGLEGSHVYKINGYYYLYSTYGGGDGFQVALRSKNIYGPYEQKIVIRDNGNLGTGIHQGALIETPTGEWWSVIFQDGGAFGRFPTLQPVRWVDDWPMVGVDGKGVVTYKKPNVGKEYPIKVLPTSDEFDSAKLGMQWGWNHNPDSTKWSLSKNPGYLRLSTVKVASNLREARNTLTQRIFAYYSKSVASTGTIKMDINNMHDGDIAGLAVFQDPYAYIGVKKTNGVQYIIMVNNGKTIDSVAMNSSILYLRAHAIYGASKATFAYSFDNELYQLLGNELEMKFNLSVFTGNKFCIFNYATKSTGGYVDIDWFRTDFCAMSELHSYLQVDDGILQDTNKTTVNIGDSVTLKPEAVDYGTWRWSGIGITGNSNYLTIHPVRSISITANFSNSCGMKSSINYVVTILKTNKISNLYSSSNIKIFPNPAQNEINITSGFYFSDLIITNLEGRQLIKMKYKNPIPETCLNTNFKSGIYFLTLRNDSKTEIEKIIIQ